jgi:apolipoprotein N-acyltransferase
MIPFAGLYGLGMWQATLPVPETGRAPVLRLIQPNAAQHLKWDPDMALQFFARQIEFTAAPADPRPDLIIWPETAVPTWLDNAGPAFARISDAAGNTPVVLGIQRQDAFRAFNSLVVLDGAGQVTDLYDKHHLVPFGEYLPFGSLLNGLGLSAFTAQGGFGYSAGPGARVLDLGGLGKALPLICYEAIFPQDVRAAPERPDWLLQITNDAWFGRLSGPYQHLAQARLRAVEQGLPMVRVANTGVSAVIDARGRVLDALPLNEAGFLDARLPPPLPATVYARLGDAPVAGFLGLGLLVLAGIRRKNAIDGCGGAP